MRYEVGQRVKVVNPGFGASRYGGLTGTVDGRGAGGMTKVLVAVPVAVDFHDDELAPVDVTVIEGVAETFGEDIVLIGGKYLAEAFENGDNYRVTVERLPKEG